MRVGIMTFHRAHNFGAMLQAYGLQNALNKLGAECSIVDYKCEKIEKSYKTFLVERASLKSLLSAVYHFPNRYIRRNRFESFNNKYLKKSDQIYDRGNIQDSLDQYDCFITGSDQVWNEELTGNDKNYFLKFAVGKKKISYAASLGRTRLTEKQKEEYSELLSDFSFISVREESAQEALADILNKDVELVVDPVFLLSKEEWKRFIAENKHGDYIFMYELHENNTRKLAQKIAEKTGLKIITIPNDLRGGLTAEKIYAPTVEEFLNLIYHAQYVVTDSFHVSAFAVIFNKEYYGLLKTNSNLRGLNSRLETLTARLGIKGRLFDSINDFEVAEALDYSIIDTNLTALREGAVSLIQELGLHEEAR